LLWGFFYQLTVTMTRRFFIRLLVMGVLHGALPAGAVQTPQRIVSLAPNLTEILFFLGLGGSVVGVTQFCDYPEEAKKKNKVGGMSNPSLEAVLSLRPDMVVLTTDGNQRDFAQRLRSMKVRTYVFTARRLAELSEALRNLGAALGVPETAGAAAWEIEDSLKTFKERRAAHRPQRALFIIWPEPLIVAGSGTLIDDAMTLIGLENVASRARTAYPKYSIEEILRQSPEVLFVGKGHADMHRVSASLLEKLRTMPAVKSGNVHFVSDDLYRLSPRSVRGIGEIYRIVRPSQ